MLDRHRQRHRVAHRPHAVGDQRRLGHQAGAEAAGLHALGRAAAVEVDLVVAPALAQPRAVRELRRDRCRRAAAPPDARRGRNRGAAARRHAAAPVPSPSRCRAARAREIRRRKNRQCRSVQSIIGATQKRQGDGRGARRAGGRVSVDTPRILPAAPRAVARFRSPLPGPSRTARAARASASCRRRCAGTRPSRPRGRAAGTWPRRAR